MNYFVMYWKQVIKELKKQNKTKEFNKLTDDESRIKFMFSFCEDNVQYDLSTSRPKDLEGANALKDKGYKLFTEGNNSSAVSVYNEAIKICPHNTLEGRKLYAILIENRSSVFFARREYQKGLKDIAFLKQYGHHPNLAKLKSHETKALKALKKSINRRTTETNTEELTWCSGNITYPALSNKLTIKTDTIMGRYVVATDKIKTGEILAVEEPYAAVVDSDKYCNHCATSTNQIYACRECQEVYCGLQCLEKAKVYHQYECTISSALFRADLGYARLALRMITQRPLQKIIKEELNAKHDKVVDVYKTKDYYNVGRLVQHEDVQDSEDVLQTTFTAVFLLKLLKSTTYFGYKAKKIHLSKDEVFVGNLLMTYLRILKYNGRLIEELQKSKIVGVGLYPTLSLFNHSCEPSVMRYSINNKMVLRSIKPIESGDIVYDNYGLLYTDMAKQERINLLEKYYRFICTCRACIDDWTVFNNNKHSVLRKEINLLQVEEELNCLLQKIEMTQIYFKLGYFGLNRKLYGEILDTVFKYFALPNDGIFIIQQRLRYCFQWNRNKNVV